MDKAQEQELQKAFNDTFGQVLTFLDESNVGLTCKKAVKSSLYELLDRTIKPMLTGKGKGNYDSEDQDSRGNR